MRERAGERERERTRERERARARERERACSARAASRYRGAQESGRERELSAARRRATPARALQAAAPRPSSRTSSRASGARARTRPRARPTERERRARRPARPHAPPCVLATSTAHRRSCGAHGASARGREEAASSAARAPWVRDASAFTRRTRRPAAAASSPRRARGAWRCRRRAAGPPLVIAVEENDGCARRRGAPAKARATSCACARTPGDCRRRASCRPPMPRCVRGWASRSPSRRRTMRLPVEPGRACRRVLIYCHSKKQQKPDATGAPSLFP